jgi:hypothetical protein
MIKLDSLKIDTQAERDGEWIDIDSWPGLDPNAPTGMTPTPGLGYCTRSLNAPDYKSARQKWLEEIEQKRKENPDAVTDEYIDAGNGKLIAEKLLLGWRGLDQDYSKEAALALLPSPEGRIFRDMIVYCASKVGRRKVEFVKEAGKN